MDTVTRLALVAVVALAAATSYASAAPYKVTTESAVDIDGTKLTCYIRTYSTGYQIKNCVPANWIYNDDGTITIGS